MRSQEEEAEACALHGSGRSADIAGVELNLCLSRMENTGPQLYPRIFLAIKMLMALIRAYRERPCRRIVLIRRKPILRLADQALGKWGKGNNEYIGG